MSATELLFLLGGYIFGFLVACIIEMCDDVTKYFKEKREKQKKGIDDK